jgi:periplasmic divalent cation tolerance protein
MNDIGSVALVLTTVATSDDARALADTLVGERLAACVTALPAQSTYRWRGAVERTEETLVIIKTAPSRLTAVVERLRVIHPYELPEILFSESIGTSAAYATWVAQEAR